MLFFTDFSKLKVMSNSLSHLQLHIMFKFSIEPQPIQNKHANNQ